MADAGSALMGIGTARGDNRAGQAAEAAIASPLLEASIDGARGVLLMLAGGSDLGLFEVNEAANRISEAAHAEANIIFGAVIDDSLGDEVKVTVIAAGFDGPMEQEGAFVRRGRSSAGDDRVVTGGTPRAAEPFRTEAAPDEEDAPSERPIPMGESPTVVIDADDDDDLEIPSFLR